MTRRDGRVRVPGPFVLMLLLAAAGRAAAQYTVAEFPVPAGSHPHDVAPAPDGGVWYTAQYGGALGRLDPATGKTVHVPLGQASAPHGVIVGPDGAAWGTDGGLNAVVRVDPAGGAPRVYALPAGSPRINMNTAAFDGRGRLWFTGQAGYYGSVDPGNARAELFRAPGGPGPYGIDAGPDGIPWYASLAGSHIARIDPADGRATVLQPPTRGQGARRIWADSRGVLWITGWLSGDLIRYDPAAGAWKEIRLPGARPQPYAVYVDERDKVWVSDWGSNAIVMYDPVAGSFRSFPLPKPGADVRQMLGRRGELWAAASGIDSLIVIRW
jgi:virginiamycin B lyase